jgi:hypothetical protein
MMLISCCSVACKQAVQFLNCVMSCRRLAAARSDGREKRKVIGHESCRFGLK